MIKLHDLKSPKGANREKRRVARGIAGKGGKTAGRGTKGQKARDTIKPGFEGGQLPLVQRIPKLKGFTNPFSIRYNVINLSDLTRVDGDNVDPDVLRDQGLLRAKGMVKVLGQGDVDRALNLKVHAVSASAKAKILSKGGSVEILPSIYKSRKPAGSYNALTSR